MREKEARRKTERSQAYDDEVWEWKKVGHGSDDMKENESDCDFDGGKVGWRERETEWGCGGEWEEQKEREMGRKECLTHGEFGEGI